MAPFSYAQAAKGKAVPSPQLQASRNDAVQSPPLPQGVLMERPSIPTDEHSEKQHAAETDKSQSDIKEPSKDATVAQSTPHNGDSVVSEHPPTNAGQHGESNGGSSHVSDAATPAAAQPIGTTEQGADRNGGSSTNTTSREATSTAEEPKDLKEAPLPPVNFWQQRAQAAKTKLAQPASPVKPTGPSPDAKPAETTSAATVAKTDARSAPAESSASTGVSNSQEKLPKLNGVSTRKGAELEKLPSRHEEKKAPVDTKPTAEPKAADSKNKSASRAGVLPPQDSQSWPTPESAQDEERRRALSKTEKPEKETSPVATAKPHGKNEWVPVPFIPTVKFNTPLPTSNRRGGSRASTRGGREAGSRGGGSSSTKSGAPATNAGSQTSTDGQQQGKTDQKLTRASSLPPRSSREGGNSNQEKRNAESGQGKRSMTLADGDRTPANPRNDLPLHAIPGDGANNNSTGSVASVVLGHETAAASSTPFDLTNHKADRLSGAQSDAGIDQSSNPRHRNRLSYYHESTGSKAEDFAERRRSAADIGPTNGRGGWTGRRGDDNSRNHENRERGEPRPDRSRGGMRGGRGGGQYGNSHTPPGTQLPNGHLTPLQTNPLPSKSSAGFQPQQYNGSNQFTPSTRNSNYRSGPRSQNVPADAGYPRFPSAMPGMAPMPYPSPTYDMSPMQPMSAGMPFAPYYDQYALLGLVSFQLDYYFSDENLVKDMFLRRQMDSQGFVQLNVILEFRRLKSLTDDVDLVKFVCYRSPNVELRIGSDGRDIVRKSEGWERWVLEMAERDPSARNDGPTHLEPPMTPYPQVFEPQQMTARSAGLPPGADPAFHPFGVMPPHFTPLPIASQINGYAPVSPPSNENGPVAGDAAPHANHTEHPAADGAKAIPEEPDAFQDEQIDTLTVVMKNMSEHLPKASYHSNASRTFSNGSIDGKAVVDELQKGEERPARSQGNANGPVGRDPEPKASVPPSATDAAPSANSVRLYWVKDEESSGTAELPADCKLELYTHLHVKALHQRDMAAPGFCPYDMDVLYQFWSHFLIRNFNTRMYNEFRQLAYQDASHNLSLTGINHLIKFYSESLSSSQTSIRKRVARHYVDLVNSEVNSSERERPAFEQLRLAWRNGALNMKNRKRISDLMDAGLKAELDR